jgi:hypothetical protein
MVPVKHREIDWQENQGEKKEGTVFCSWHTGCIHDLQIKQATHFKPHCKPGNSRREVTNY